MTNETIHTEGPEDFASIREVHLASFPNAGEADLVDELRQSGNSKISLVAKIEGRVVGHIMCSEMTAPFPALGLAPVAVLPEHRKQGIADRLIRQAMQIAKDSTHQAMFVLGDPAYYGRFGFDAALAADFETPFAGPHFMVMPLRPGALPVKTGSVSYAPEFDKLG